jgi:ribosomal subunit interface protein
VPLTCLDKKGVPPVDVIFKARHTEVRDRFRRHATAKLAKIEKLDNRAIRVDVEITAERNPRLADRRERVELTVSSRGPAIRAEAAAEDRFAALDIALAKLESRLRRACDRRKGKHGGHASVRLIDLPEIGESGAELAGSAANGTAASDGAADAEQGAAGVVPIEMQGDGPLMVREKFHAASPMTIDQALFEMELVGHDFYLFSDAASGMPSVVYRRRGYQYGVIRLLEESSAAQVAQGGPDWVVQQDQGNGQRWQRFSSSALEPGEFGAQSGGQGPGTAED